jgi:hypothetical protein
MRPPTPIPGMYPPLPTYSNLTLTWTMGDVSVSVSLGPQSLESLTETLKDMLPPNMVPLMQAASGGQQNIMRQVLAGLAAHAQKEVNDKGDAPRPPNARAKPIRFATAKEEDAPDGQP